MYANSLNDNGGKKSVGLRVAEASRWANSTFKIYWEKTWNRNCNRIKSLDLTRV